MRYSFISAAVLAFISAVSAANPTADFDPMTVPSRNTDTVAAGSTYTIKWTAPTKYNGTVTLTLMEGATTGTLTLADTIGDGVVNSLNSYAWEIPTDIASFPFYGIQISYDADPTIFQWSFPFHITGASSTNSSASSATASTKTVQVSSNPSYTSTATSSSSKITSAAKNSTTVVSVTSSAATTTAANATLSTSATLTPSSSSTSASSTSPAAAKSSSAAMANLAKGSFAVIGGAVLAFAL